MGPLKHSPGPWVAVQTNFVTTKRAWESHEMGELKSSFQAIVSMNEGEEQANANATLIATAPEMLESLFETFMSEGAHPLHLATKVLIARARGKS